MVKTPSQRRGAALSLAFAVLAAAATTLPGCLPEDGKEDAATGRRDADRTRSGRTSAVAAASAKPLKNRKEAQIAFDMVNDERARRGLPVLARRADIDEVAYAHARDLMRMNRLSHVSSDGRQLEHRLERLEWEWAGENLARNKGFESPAAEAVKGWIASPQHFENMFRADFTESGMAALYDPESGFTYLVQVFINPVV